MTFTFRPHERLRLTRDFQRARRAGRRRAGRWLALWVYPRDESPPRATRLGIVVGRRHGGAVQRNRFKRRLREVFRLGKSRWPRGWDVVVTPKAGGAGFPPPQKDLQADFTGLMGRSGKLEL